MCFYLFSKIGEEQSAEDAEDGPPELLVINYYFKYYCVAFNIKLSYYKNIVV